jgi:phosphoglycolate phosphatase
LRAVVFDLDGTLVDSFEDIATAANHVLGLKGLPPFSTADVKRHVGRGLENLLRGLMPKAPEEEIAASVAFVKTYYRNYPVERSAPYPGVLETLDALGSLGHYRAVLSNKAHSIVTQIADILELSPRLEAVWGHKEDYPLKPDPTSLFRILESAHVSPSDCIVVGDAAPDLQLARNAGAQFCGVTWGMTSREEWVLKEEDWLIDRPEELPPLLQLV